MYTAAIATFKSLVAKHGMDLVKNVKLDATVKANIDANAIASEFGKAIETVFKKIGDAFSGNHLGITISNLSGHELQLLNGWPFAPQPARGLVSRSLLQSAAEVTLEPGEVDGASWTGVGLDACCAVYAYRVSGTDTVLTFSFWVPATGNVIGTLVAEESFAKISKADKMQFFKSKFRPFAGMQGDPSSLSGIATIDIDGVTHTLSASIGTDRKLRVKFERSDLFSA